MANCRQRQSLLFTSVHEEGPPLDQQVRGRALNMLSAQDPKHADGVWTKSSKGPTGQAAQPPPEPPGLSLLFRRPPGAAAELRAAGKGKAARGLLL